MSNLKSQNHSLNPKNELKFRRYRFSIDIINASKDFPKERTFDIIAKQLLRSSTSIGANIVEVKSSSSRRDFIKFYEIALKSANETKYWLGLLRDGLNFDGEKINIFLAEDDEISKMIAASLITLKGKRL
ncbi:MAG: four helix bundle protein [Candidatus Paceibacterota bacterium]|jgi:four helix bundle protein